MSSFAPFLSPVVRPVRLLLPALLALVVLAGCDSGEDPPPASAALLPDSAHYVWSIESSLVENDSLLFSDATEVTVRAVSRNASVPGYDGLIELEAQTATGRSQTWYQLTSERLREVAYSASFQTPQAGPRLAAGTADLFGLPRVVAEWVQQHASARGVSVDSLIFLDDPRVVYELPLGVGTSWVSFTNPFRSTRAVVGREAVGVEAGMFDCFVIRTEIEVSRDENQEFEWFDYVSAERGLVLRTVDATILYGTPEGDLEGYTRLRERLELIADD